MLAEDGGGAQHPVARAFEDRIRVDIRKGLVLTFEQFQTYNARTLESKRGS